MGHNERNIEAIRALLLKHRRSHCNLLSRFVFTTNVTSEITKCAVAGSSHASLHLLGNKGVSFIVSDLESFLGFDYLVALNFSQGLANHLWFATLCLENKFSINKINLDVLRALDCSSQDALRNLIFNFALDGAAQWSCSK